MGMTAYGPIKMKPQKMHWKCKYVACILLKSCSTHWLKSGMDVLSSFAEKPICWMCKWKIIYLYLVGSASASGTTVRTHATALYFDILNRVKKNIPLRASPSHFISQQESQNITDRKKTLNVFIWTCLTCTRVVLSMHPGKWSIETQESCSCITSMLLPHLCMLAYVNRPLVYCTIM